MAKLIPNIDLIDTASVYCEENGSVLQCLSHNKHAHITQDDLNFPLKRL